MAWEKRKQKNYYYRKRRQGRRVISEYIGSAKMAGTIAALDLRRRQIDQTEQQALAELQTLETEVDQICQLLQTLVHAYLLAAGCHAHRGQWRKIRTS
jgi:hypothetical protein